MSAPRLNRQLVLEAPNVLGDGAGGFVQGWVPLGMVWAEVTARSGRETAQSGAPISTFGYRVIVRATPVGSSERPNAKQRFREDARFFNIEAVAEYDPAGRYLLCLVQEEQVV